MTFQHAKCGYWPATATNQILHKVRTVQPHSLQGLGKLQVNVQNLLDFYLLENAFEF